MSKEYTLLQMIGQIFLTTTLQMSMLGAHTSPSQEALKKVLSTPGDNMTVVIILAVVIVALVVGIFYLIKKQCEERA